MSAGESGGKFITNGWRTEKGFNMSEEKSNSGNQRHVSFPLGELYSTVGALSALQRAGQLPSELLDRHQRGDWGDICAEDWSANDLAVVEGDRLLSEYKTSLGERVWIITEWNRAVTTFLLPSDY